MAALLALCALLSCRGTSPVSVRSCATARYVLGAQERRRKVPFSGFVKSSERGPPSRADRRRRDESLSKSDPRNGNRSSRAWSGDQTKHGNRKYDIEIRYCHFVSRTYSQMYDGHARARTADTHAHRTTWTRLYCRTKHEHTCGNSAQNRYTQQMQRAILRMGLSLGPHSSQNSPHARIKRAEDRPSTMPPRACEGGKGVRGGERERVDMRRGDEGRMEEGTTGLRGVATSARGGHTCVAAGR